MINVRRSTRSRRAFLGGIAGVSAALIAACTTQAPSATPAPATSTSAAPPSTAAPTPAPKAPASQPTATTAAAPKAAATPTTQMLSGEINVNFVALYTNAGGWEAVAKQYLEMHPGVKIVVDLKPTVTGYQEWLTAQFASGNPQPSLISANYVPGDLVAQGKLVDFLLYQQKISPYTGKAWQEDFGPGAWGDPNPTTNAVNLLNTENYQGVWFYNKEAFTKAGVEGPPATYDELLAACEALSKAGYIPLAIEGDRTGFGRRITWTDQTYFDQFSRSAIEIVRAQPGDWNYRKGVDDVWKYDPSDPLNDGPDKVTVNRLRVLKAVRDHEIRVDGPDVKEMRNNEKRLLGPYTQPGWYGTADAYPLFVTQKAAMYIDVTSVLFRLDKDVAKLGGDAKPFEFGAFNYPSMTTSHVQAPARGREGTLGFYGVPKKDQRQNDLELDFLMFFSSPDGYNTYLQASLDPQNVTGFINGLPTVKHAKLPDELMQKFDSIPRSYAPWSITTSPTNRLTCGWINGEIQQAWLDQAQQFFADEITVDEFGTLYQKAIDDAWPSILQQSKLTNDDLDHPEKRPAQ